MTKELNEITENIIKDQERFKKVFADMAKVKNTFAYRMAPTIQAIERLNKNMAPYTKIAKDIEASFASFRSKALKMQNNLNLITAIVNAKYLNNPEFARFANQAKDMAKIVADLKPGTIFEVYAQTIEVYSKGENSGSIQVAISDIEEKAKIPGTVLSLEFYLSLVFSIILFLISQSSSEESDERLFERLDRLEATLLQGYSDAEKEEEGASFYIVKRSVNFRYGPSTKHIILDVLYRNQKVKLISRKSKWIEVEYYDHIDDSYKRGWVFKKYLKLLNPRVPDKYK